VISQGNRNNHSIWSGSTLQVAMLAIVQGGSAAEQRGETRRAVVASATQAPETEAHYHVLIEQEERIAVLLLL
jgi:hypothetical protein